MAAVELPGAAPIRGRQGHDEPSWYQPDLSNLSASTLQFFQEYVGLKSEKEVIQHIKAVRQKAWEIVPYPCIGLFAFLDFIIQLSPIYPSVVSRVRAGQTLLDLGCCFGQNIRKLAFDAGLPCSKNLMGVDIDVRFIDLGYDLFRDRDRLGAEFCFGDILDEAFLAEKREEIDMIYLGNFLHLFGVEQQKSITMTS
ncbi:hypothetical protein UCRNP2_4326 [Neofusicoccum parvum UCRNP2]|uniref:Methyltransferase domain-containing protein n=1 Tax=Botryosphaeria parva (strain UCR-NP2) TaxID=1287680 RepID=R1EMA7_BOTPV|nr:hypothetical protein UCRNP2_4326 [Neofusicoccum parvum UCRNP2]